MQLRGRFLRLLGRFARSKGGNVALIFAVTLIPMLAATGMVVDYTRAAKAKQQLQDALDSTALFLSKNSSVSTMNSATLLQTAQNYFNVNFTNTDVNGTAISPSYSSSGPSVTVSPRPRTVRAVAGRCSSAPPTIASPCLAANASCSAMLAWYSASLSVQAASVP